MSISSAAVLVELNISVWTANKLDRGETEKVTSSNSAVHNAAQVRKNLMAGTSLRKDIADFAAGFRTWHIWNTLSWADKGPRLLPVSRFLDYKPEANDRERQYWVLVDRFCLAYPQLKQTAHNYLGSLFDAADYPSVEEVRTKFGLRLVFSPLPESGDFRLDVPQQDLSDMKESYEESYNARLEDAMREPWERLHKALTHMSAKLTEAESDTEKKRYHDTLITNPRELCELLTHLNVTKDPKLEKARYKLERTLDGLDIEDIKESAGQRADVKTNVDEILKNFW